LNRHILWFYVLVLVIYLVISCIFSFFFFLFNIMYSLFQRYRSVIQWPYTIHSTHHSTYPPQCPSPSHPLPQFVWSIIVYIPIFDLHLRHSFPYCFLNYISCYSTMGNKWAWYIVPGIIYLMTWKFLEPSHGLPGAPLSTGNV